jgi:hypothetical protein
LSAGASRFQLEPQAQLPPLRERREDLPRLIDHFVRTYAAKNAKAIAGLTRDAREAPLRYDYPANVRELKTLVERAVVLTRDEIIGIADLPLTLHDPAPEPAAAPGLDAAVEALERRMIRGCAHPGERRADAGHRPARHQRARAALQAQEVRTLRRSLTRIGSVRIGNASRRPGQASCRRPCLRASRQEPRPSYCLGAAWAPSDDKTLMAPVVAGRCVHPLPRCSLLACVGDRVQARYRDLRQRTSFHATQRTGKRIGHH